VLEDGFDATPAIVGDAIYLRGREFLYCITEGLSPWTDLRRRAAEEAPGVPFRKESAAARTRCRLEPRIASAAAYGTTSPTPSRRDTMCRGPGGASKFPTPFDRTRDTMHRGWGPRRSKRRT